VSNVTKVKLRLTERLLQLNIKLAQSFKGSKQASWTTYRKATPDLLPGIPQAERWRSGGEQASPVTNNRFISLSMKCSGTSKSKSAHKGPVHQATIILGTVPGCFRPTRVVKQ